MDLVTRLYLMDGGKAGPVPPPGYTWLLWGGQKVYFNGEPVYVLKEST